MITNLSGTGNGFGPVVRENWRGKVKRTMAADVLCFMLTTHWAVRVKILAFLIKMTSMTNKIVVGR